MRGLKHYLRVLWDGGSITGSELRAGLAGAEAREFTSPENPSTSLDNPEPWLGVAMGGQPSRTGIPITPESAMRQSAVFSCVRNIAEDMASLPLVIVGPTRQKLTAHRAYTLLHDSPNPLQTSFTWRQMSAAHCQLWGNSYSEIEVDALGEPVAFWPLPPWCVKPVPISGGTDCMYRVQTPNGVVWLTSDRMLHVPGLGFNGLEGRSVLSWARESIGLGLASEQYGASFFGNSSRPSGYIKLPSTVGKEKAPDVLKAWNQSNQGLDNVGRTAMLMQGAEWEKMALTNEEAQFLESRKFSVGDIARFWRMPPSMIGDTEQKWANSEQQAIQYVVHCLSAWLVRYEQEYKRKLLRATDATAKHMVNALARGDMVARGRYYATGRQWGWLCVDDIRELEDQPPLPDNKGQVFLQPINMQEAGTEPADPTAGGGPDASTEQLGTQSTPN